MRSLTIVAALLCSTVSVLAAPGHSGNPLPDPSQGCHNPIAILHNPHCSGVGGHGHHDHGHHYHGHGGHKPPTTPPPGGNTDKPKGGAQQQQGDGGKQSPVFEYLYMAGACMVPSHFYDTFIRDRGQYKRGTYDGHTKRTKGDEAASFGNCIVPFVGGYFARKLRGKEADEPLNYYTDPFWYGTKHGAE